MEDLLKNAGIDDINILPEGRNDSKLAIPLHAKYGYSFSDHILSPNVCNNGKWEHKSVKYEGYHELCYLHPKYFTPDKAIVEKYIKTDRPYFIIRLAKLNAHHDDGRAGIDNAIAKKIIHELEAHGNIYISAERELPAEFEKHRISINPLDIHHIIAFADLYLGDSQTMAAEAAVLGTPSIRYNDFVGQISYLEELEHKYDLTYGVRTSNTTLLFEKIKHILALDNRKRLFLEKRDKMLSEKIDVNEFFVWFIENYPESLKPSQINPQYH